MGEVTSDVVGITRDELEVDSELLQSQGKNFVR